MRTSHHILGVLAGLMVPATAWSETVAVVAAGVPPHEAEAQAAVSKVRSALAGHPGLELLPVDKERFLFASPPPPDPTADLEAAKKDLDAAEAHVQSLEVEAAERALKRARERLGPYEGLPDSMEHDRRCLELLVAMAYISRQETALARHLATYASRFPETPNDPDLWPPALTRRLKELTGEFSTAVKITSEPVGSAFVDGQPVGTTPVEHTNLAAGRHRIQVQAEHRFSVSRWIETTAQEPIELAVSLPPDVAKALALAPKKDALPNETLGALERVARETGVERIYVVSPLPEDRLLIRWVEIEPEASERARAEVANTPAGASRAITQLQPSFSDMGTVSTWSWVGAGAGAAVVGLGVGLRFMARSTQNELASRQGALTQSEAFALRDEVDQKALAGTILIGMGVAVTALAVTWLGYELATGASP